VVAVALEVGEERGWVGLTNWALATDKKECWAENEEKNWNLDYVFCATDLAFEDDVS
jgi:hypothetical protein